MIETTRSSKEFGFLREETKLSFCDTASTFHQNDRNGRRPKTSNVKKLSLEQVEQLYKVTQKATFKTTLKLFLFNNFLG